MAAWSAKVFSSSISLSENGFGGMRAMLKAPMPRPSQNIGASSVE